MSLQDSIFSEEVERDITEFALKEERKRVLVFPPVNNYRRFIIHQFVQNQFENKLYTFSIGQGAQRRTVVCYRNDVIRDPKLNGAFAESTSRDKISNSGCVMGVEGHSSPLVSPDNSRQRQVKSVPSVGIYRPPPARKTRCDNQIVDSHQDQQALSKANRQKRPDRAVYVPRHRRSNEIDQSPLPEDNPRVKISTRERRSTTTSPIEKNRAVSESCSSPHEIHPEREEEELTSLDSVSNGEEFINPETEFNRHVLDSCEGGAENNRNVIETMNGTRDLIMSEDSNRKDEETKEELLNKDQVVNHKNRRIVRQNLVSDVLLISDEVPKNKEIPVKQASPDREITKEKKVKKVERPKSKPAPPPVPVLKINRDECDWDSLFDDNGDCLDPTLIEELTAAVGEVTIEQPKSDYRAFTKAPVEVSNDEFGHVIEIYNFPSDFKTSDLAAVFSPFKNGGFELKWVDDTHCLGVFSSPLVAAEVLSSDHSFVKTRPLSEATALSKTKARRSAEFLQPYRARPETCAALARRLVTGALGVRLATARQEREREKIVLREAKERRRLANKQREDAWEGIIAEK